MDHVDALLPEYLAGDLDPQAKARVEAHLRTCVRCQEELRGLEQAFFALAEALPPVPPPQGTWEGIRARLRRARRGRDWVPVLLAAALAGAFFLGAYWGQHSANQEVLLEKVAYWASDAEARWHHLKSNGENLGLLFWQEDGRCFLLLREPPPPGQAYRLWGESGSALHPLGQTRGRVLEADYRGFRTLVLSLEGPPGGPAPGRILARFTLP